MRKIQVDDWFVVMSEDPIIPFVVNKQGGMSVLKLKELLGPTSGSASAQ